MEYQIDVFLLSTRLSVHIIRESILSLHSWCVSPCTEMNMGMDGIRSFELKDAGAFSGIAEAGLVSVVGFGSLLSGIHSSSQAAHASLPAKYSDSF